MLFLVSRTISRFPLRITDGSPGRALEVYLFTHSHSRLVRESLWRLELCIDFILTLADDTFTQHAFHVRDPLTTRELGPIFRADGSVRHYSAPFAKWIDENQDKLVDRLAEAVAIPSVSVRLISAPHCTR